MKQTRLRKIENAFAIIYLLKDGLVKDLSYLTGTYSSTTFSDSESKTFFKSNRVDQVYFDSNVITWHNHFDVSRKLNLTSNVSSS